MDTRASVTGAYPLLPQRNWLTGSLRRFIRSLEKVHRLGFAIFANSSKRSVGMISMNYCLPARVNVWMSVAVLDAIAILFRREGTNGLAWTEVQQPVWPSQTPRHCPCRNRVWLQSSCGK